ncbi:hypothetical protein [Clostridium cellulovorans]|uniref:DUF7922 domain-containing protein n=1 Tax=Clostridium cellulovorans (strain ATCC 35296 / DSM 3052 / OCM 3 / 743B) TaxID=573061 RepID=D9SPQ8_CLOC7|nr:hypothetical protein [Clostridium cellulovorans]ADL50107.1 hypothetical protein Clocel_0327 [Clostridium cellulovorans 743B]
MTQKKRYSRLFIILQENDKGYGLSSDKAPNGYVKIETKNNKCKVNFYVQNLKKIEDDYHMVLVCDKKVGDKLIDLGKMKVDSGKADMVLEYPVENIARTGVAMDKICGTAIGIFKDGKLVSVMCGFSNKEIPEDWMSFEVLESIQNDKEPTTRNIDEDEGYIEEQEDEEEEKVEETPDTRDETNEDEDDAEEDILEEAEPDEEKHRGIDDIVDIIEDITDIVEEVGDEVEEELDKLKKKKEKEDDEEEIEAFSEYSFKDKKEEPPVDFEKYERSIPNRSDEEDYPRGTMGEFFTSLTEGFRKVDDFFPELKRTKWYKVPIETIEDMYSTNDYKKYTAIYYPMVNNYPYFSKYGHFLIGYKCDHDYNLKYIVYGVPGKKGIMDQPFGGKTGYVVWAPVDNDRTSDDDLGYWLMFYDFKNTTVVIPMEN